MPTPLSTSSDLLHNSTFVYKLQAFFIEPPQNCHLGISGLSIAAYFVKGRAARRPGVPPKAFPQSVRPTLQKIPRKVLYHQILGFVPLLSRFASFTLFKA